MPLPPEFNTVTLHGRYRKLDGSIPPGTVTFVGGLYLRAPTSDTIITPASIAVTLNALGEFTINLPTTDDPDIIPTGWSYRVTEIVDGTTRSFDLVIPYVTVGTLELADLATDIPTITALGTGPYVRTVNGLAGDVQVTGSGGPASETTAGIAEIATTSEVTAGTDNTRFVTPFKLTQWGVPKSLVDVKGDLLGGSGPDTLIRVPAPTADGQVLTASSAVASGMVWAAPTGGGGGGVTPLVTSTTLTTSPTLVTQG